MSGFTTLSLPAVSPRVLLLLSCLAPLPSAQETVPRQFWISISSKSGTCDPQPTFRAAAPLRRPSPRVCGKIRPMWGLAWRSRPSPPLFHLLLAVSLTEDCSRAALSLFNSPWRLYLFFVYPDTPTAAPSSSVWSRGLGAARSALSRLHGATAGRCEGDQRARP